MPTFAEGQKIQSYSIFEENVVFFFSTTKIVGWKTYMFGKTYGDWMTVTDMSSQLDEAIKIMYDQAEDVCRRLVETLSKS